LILGELALANCSQLQSICIPSSVRTISSFCFQDCTRLSTVTFEPGSTRPTFGTGVFANCTVLTWTWALRYDACNVC
jgi:hypothetical protein